MIKNHKVWKTVLVSWLFTLMGLFNLIIVTVVIGFFVVRFNGYGVAIGIFAPTILIALTAFIISERLVNIVIGARMAETGIDDAFLTAVKINKKRTGMWITPRAYVLELDVPNAMAYGMGFPGLCAVGVTEKLVKMLSQDELNAVVAHEFAHIRCRDVGMLSVIGLLQTLMQKFSKLLSSRQSHALMSSTVVFIFVWIALQITRGIFALSRSAISQERELAADALGASYTGSALPLISALKKLHDSHLDKKENDTPFSDLMVSHPGLEERITSLKNLHT